MDTSITTGEISAASEHKPGSMGKGSHGGACAHCGQSLNQNGGLEQFLGKLGISDDMLANLKSSINNVDLDEYLNTARDYLKTGSDKATSYTKENPGTGERAKFSQRRCSLCKLLGISQLSV